MGDLLPREALLSKLSRSRPKIVALTAPAGFGKSTFARQFAAERGGGCVIDGEGALLDMDLARRVLTAIGAPTALLADGASTIAERLDGAAALWQQSAISCAIFEHVDRFTPSAREFLARLLTVRPPACAVVLCSRSPMVLPFARLAPPHEQSSLRPSDLAFDEDEVRALFGSLADDATLARIDHVARGWPVAVLLLHRFAGEGQLGEVMERLDARAFREFHEYVKSEVLPSFDERAMQALVLCAALGVAHADDFDPEDTEMLRSSGFVRTNADGSLSLHPMIASAVLDVRRAEREPLVRDLARSHEARGDALRAAELYARLDDRYAAARALGSREVLGERSPTERYRALLAQLDPGAIVRYPRLWAVSALVRLFRVDSNVLLDEAETVWRTLAPSQPPTERFYVLAVRVLLLAFVGRAGDAAAELESFMRSVPVAEPPASVLDGYAHYLRGLLLARSGQFEAGERDLNASLALVDRMDVAAAGIYRTLGAQIARIRGEWSVERQFLERSRERSVVSGLENFVAYDIAEQVIGAWFSGDRAGFNDRAVELEQYVDRFGIEGFAYFAHVARGRNVAPGTVDLQRFVIYGRLIALSRSRDENERASLARDAFERARALQLPFVETLAAVAVALCDPVSFDDAVASALSAAARCDAPAFSHAVNAFAHGYDNVGMLAPFVTHITRDRSEAAPVALDILAGRVRVDGAAVRVSGRELELLAALSQRREPTPRARLAAMLWPDLDEFAARNALSVCLHRLRSHVKRDDAVERDVDGYRLHADAFVDVWEIERAAIAMRSREHLREADRALLARALARLQEERAAAIESWEWFAPTLRRLDELRVELAHRLATDALERGDPEDALTYAQDIIAQDPCDEPAREIAIRAHLAIGDRAAAMRHYRQYRDVLKAEFAAEPSSSLTKLVMGA